MSNPSSSQDLDHQAQEIGIGGYSSPEGDKTKYKLRMEQRKEIQIKRVAQRNKRKGLIIIFTGNGKGKTTAALGMAIRTVGHSKSVAIIQFIKGGWEPGEVKALKYFGDLIKFHALGEGFTWESQDREKDQELVSEAWSKSLTYLKDPKYQLVILDEINIALKLGYISSKEVISGITQRPKLTHVILTGRSAPKDIVESADLVTEMKLLHHPFREQGIKAQEGVEY